MTRTVRGLQIVTDYTQAEEDALAAILAGIDAYSSVIYNTTIPALRMWNGTTFESVAQVTNDSIPLATATLPGGIPAFGATPALKIIRINAAGTGIEYVTLAGGGDMLKTDNLSGLANYVTARINLGLGNVDNTTDTGKPVSTATQTALNTKPTIIYNQSTAVQGAGFAVDTYLVGSSILIPASSLKIGSRYHLVFNVNKTAAGTAAPIIIIRFGILGSIVDAARCTFTFSAQTAALDSGTFEVWATFRVVGGSAVLQGICQRRHGASITGLGTLVGETQTVTSGSFDSAVASSIIGVSVNGGTSAAWTVQLVQAKLENLV